MLLSSTLFSMRQPVKNNYYSYTIMNDFRNYFSVLLTFFFECRDKSKSVYIQGIVLHSGMHSVAGARGWVYQWWELWPRAVRYLLAVNSPPGWLAWTSDSHPWTPTHCPFHHRHLRGCTIYCCLPYTLGLLWDDALGGNPSPFPAGVWTLIRSQMTSASQALDGTKQALFIQRK